MPLIIKATSMSLVQFPELNATVNEGATEVTRHASHNISVAVDTPGPPRTVNKECAKPVGFDVAEDLQRLIALGRKTARGG